jgi:hypothetical protein
MLYLYVGVEWIFQLFCRSQLQTYFQSHYLNNHGSASMLLLIISCLSNPIYAFFLWLGRGQVRNRNKATIFVWLKKGSGWLVQTWSPHACLSLIPLILSVHDPIYLFWSAGLLSANKGNSFLKLRYTICRYAIHFRASIITNTKTLTSRSLPSSRYK